MAKSKKQRRIEAKDRKDARKVLMVVSISTLLLLTMAFVYFSNS
ncbi:MAG: hypothetical protein AAFW73_04550 [Bacteroidota bacterium]